MYAIKSIYGSRYIKEVDFLGVPTDSTGKFTTKNIIKYDNTVYLNFVTEEEAWEYINQRTRVLTEERYGLRTKYNNQHKGSFKRILNSLSNLCVVQDGGLEYHGKNSKYDIERFKWCKLRKYNYYR